MSASKVASPNEPLDLDSLVDIGDDTSTEGADRGDTLTIDDAGLDGDASEGSGEAESDADSETDATEEKGTKEKGTKEKGTKEKGTEGEEDTDDDAGKEDADEADEGKKDAKDVKDDVPHPMVPRARLTEAQHKRRDAESKAAELEHELENLREQSGQGKAFKEFTARVDKLYEDVEVARAEGQYKEAAKIQRELDNMRDGANAAKSEYVAQQKAVQAQDLAAYEAVVDQVELLMPQLDPNNEDFDQSLLEEVSVLRDGLEAKGIKPATALKKALKYVVGHDIFETKSMRREDVAPPAKKPDVKRNVVASKKQPPDTDKSAPAERALKVNVDKLTDEEYDKLPETTRQRLRGDFLTS